MDFNHSATTYVEPTFVFSDEKSYNPAFLNMDYYLENINLLEKEDEEYELSGSEGGYNYNLTTQSFLEEDGTEVFPNEDSQFSKADIQKIENFWKENSTNYKKVYPEGFSRYIKQINAFLSEQNTLEQSLEKIAKNLGE
jgi:hypothetical protein